jgi:hypothetical protein
LTLGFCHLGPKKVFEFSGKKTVFEFRQMFHSKQRKKMKSNWTHIDNFVGHFFALRLKRSRQTNPSLTETQTSLLLSRAKPSDDKNQASIIPDYLMVLLVEESLTVDILDILEDNPILNWRFLGGEKPTDLTSEKLIAESGVKPSFVVMLSILERDFGITASFEKCHCLHQFRTSAVAAFNKYFGATQLGVKISDPEVIRKAKRLLEKLLSDTPKIPELENVQPLRRGRIFTQYGGGIIFVLESSIDYIVSARYIPYVEAYRVFLDGSFSQNMLGEVQIPPGGNDLFSLASSLPYTQRTLQRSYRGCMISHTNPSTVPSILLMKDTENIYGHPQAVRLPSFEKGDGFKRLDFSEASEEILIGVKDDNTVVRADATLFFSEQDSDFASLIWQLCDTKVLAVGCRGIIKIYVDWSDRLDIDKPDFYFDVTELKDSRESKNSLDRDRQLVIQRVDSVWSTSGIVILFARVAKLEDNEVQISFIRYSQDNPTPTAAVRRFRLPYEDYYYFSIEAVSENTFTGRGYRDNPVLFFTDGRRDAAMFFGRAKLESRPTYLADLSNYYIPREDPPVEETESSAATSSQSSTKRK